MSQREQASAALGKWTLLAVLLGTLQATQASAIPLELTSGGIRAEDFTFLGASFPETFAQLFGPGFELTTDPRYDRFQYVPSAVLPGSMVNFSGGLQLLSGTAPNTLQTLFYGGQQYWA